MTRTTEPLSNDAGLSGCFSAGLGFSREIHPRRDDVGRFPSQTLTHAQGPRGNDDTAGNHAFSRPRRRSKDEKLNKNS